jgi:MoaA/NifB/PqqE/SkfB family radical SAM enzyme
MGFLASYLRNLASVAAGRQPTRPLLFSYYITHRCDLNCRYCCDGDGNPFKADRAPELSTAQVKDLVRILRRAASTLDVTGGEPMLRADLEEILSHARALGFRIVLNTKGIGLEERPGLMRLADVLVLSLDALDPASLAALLGGAAPAAERVLSAVNFARTHRNETGARVVLSAVATPENLDEVGRVLRFAVDNGLGFQVSPEIVGTRPNPALRGNLRYQRLMDDALVAKRKSRGVFGVRSYLEGIRDFASFSCHPLLMPTIRPDGRLYYPCLESKSALINVLEVGDYAQALGMAHARAGERPACRDCCQIFCHMALSLFQRRPLQALGELRHWRN